MLRFLILHDQKLFAFLLNYSTFMIKKWIRKDLNMLWFFIFHDQKLTFLLNYSNDQKLVRKLKSYILVPPGCNVYKYMDWTVQDQPKNLKEALIYVCIYKALYTGCPTNHHRLVNSSECLLSSILNKMLKTSCRLFR